MDEEMSLSPSDEEEGFAEEEKEPLVPDDYDFLKERNGQIEALLEANPGNMPLPAS